MPPLDVRQAAKEPLTDQIVAGLKRQIDERTLLPGVRLPSIRNFAETLGVSRFTVVEAYDRLVALGYLQSRRGAGFYAAAPASVPITRVEEDKRNQQLVWLIRHLLEAGENTLLLGARFASRKASGLARSPAFARSCSPAWPGGTAGAPSPLRPKRATGATIRSTAGAGA